MAGSKAMDNYEKYETACKSIKENIASLKHFYAYMNKIGQVTDADLSDMKEEIKEGKDEWIEMLQRYDDPDTNLDDVWG